MDESEIDYRTVNITDDPAAREYLSELGYTAVPVTTVDSGEETVAWHGFSPDKIDRLAQAHARSEA
ncbi:MAG: glutaredoxin family protein [Tomitella sp.]|nr:glutaredoxin family protein [Tomitella sp.]